MQDRKENPGRQCWQMSTQCTQIGSAASFNYSSSGKQIDIGKYAFLPTKYNLGNKLLKDLGKKKSKRIKRGG